MAVSGSVIVAVGKNLEKDQDFRKYQHIDLKGRTVIPGFVDSHAHFYFWAMSFSSVKLDGLESLGDALAKIKAHSRKMGPEEWVVGEGFSPDRWNQHIIPDRSMLDVVTGGRPAAIFSKDQHMLWSNSKALNLAGISKVTPEPKGGRIERTSEGEPTGILKEIPGYFPVLKLIQPPASERKLAFFKKALKVAYSRGVVGVHSFDGLEAMKYFEDLSKKRQLGLRINYYPPGKTLPELEKAGIRYGYGNDYFRILGVKIFADGSLGSQSALCFQKYMGSKDNYGVEVTSKEEMLKMIRDAARLGLPGAVHAIGDKAISNVLDCFERAPALPGNIRHRIEHLQMIRRADIGRLKKLNVVASMQPSHCPSDIRLVKKYWGKRGRNCFVFDTLLKKNIPLTFGSDAPIEPLDPIAGIDAAVNRKGPGIAPVFYPEERISVSQAVFGFTAGPARAASQEHERGYILPGYKADFIILSENIYKTARSRVKNVRVLATFFDGAAVYKEKGSALSF